MADRRRTGLDSGRTGSTWRRFVAQVLMVQNLSQTFGSFAASWSITNEVFYYVLYGLLAVLAAGTDVAAGLAGAGDLRRRPRR